MFDKTIKKSCDCAKTHFFDYFCSFSQKIAKKLKISTNMTSRNFLVYPWAAWVDKTIRKLTDFDVCREKRYFWLFLLIFSKNSQKFKILLRCVFLYVLKGPKSKIADPNSERCDPSFFFKPKMPQNDLFFDPWPLTFWPMTSPFRDLLAITKTHLGYKFHQDPPMGTWWKVVDSLTHSLTKSLLMGERCHPKNFFFLFWSQHMTFIYS